MKYRQFLSSLVIAIAMFSANASFAADNAAVIGKWGIALELQGQAVTIGLTVAQGANGLEGTWTGPQRSTPLSDVKYEGDTLTFTRTGQQGPVAMSFKVAGDTMTGTLATPGGDMPVTAKKTM